MKPLTLDDLLPLEEYVDRRREFFESHRRYVDRYRRVRLGPRLTLLFENRQTLWFRVHEIIRIARLVEPAHLQGELDLYNPLLPTRERLQAALLVDPIEDSRPASDRSTWKDLRGEQLSLCLGERRYPATLVTCRPEDRCIGAAHWVQLALDKAGRRLLADCNVPAFFQVQNGRYDHRSPSLTDDLRQSLVQDLELSERD
jgi:hypothetical protein